MAMTPDDIQSLERQWLGWLDHLEACIALPRDLLPYDMPHASTAWPIEAADAVGRMFRTTVRLTTAHLGTGNNLQIDEDPYEDRFCGPSACMTGSGRHPRERDVDDMGHIARARTFSPVAVYHAIANDYSSDRVAQIERQTVAKAIYSAFDLGDAPIKARAGCVVLTVRVHGEKNKYGSGINYGFSATGSVGPALHCLVTVLTRYLHRPGFFCPAQREFDSAIGYTFHGVESRTRLPLTPDVTAVFYQNKIEFLVAADVAAGLNAFLGEWLPNASEAA